MNHKDINICIGERRERKKGKGGGGEETLWIKVQVSLQFCDKYLGVTGVDLGVVVPILPCSIRLEVDPRLCIEALLGSPMYLLPKAPGVRDSDLWLPL